MPRVCGFYLHLVAVLAKGIFANRTAKVTERPNFVAVATLANSVRQWVNRQAINVFQSWEENIRQYQARLVSVISVTPSRIATTLSSLSYKASPPVS